MTLTHSYNGVMGELISVTEAANRLDISRQRVHQLIKAGTIPADRIGHVYVIDEDDVAQYDEERRPPGRPPKDEDKKP